MATVTIPIHAPFTRYPSIPVLPIGAWTITPSDTDTYSEPVTVEVHVAGTLKVLPYGGDLSGAATSITIPDAVAIPGYRPPFRVSRVYSTGTTATVIGVF